jgi:hypothetical protein
MTRGRRKEAQRAADGRRTRPQRGPRWRTGAALVEPWTSGTAAGHRARRLVDLYQWRGQSHCLAAGQVVGKVSGVGGVGAGRRRDQAGERVVCVEPCPVEEDVHGLSVEVG